MVCKNSYDYINVIITGISITGQAILRFVAPQRRQGPSAMLNFTLIREYLGVSGS